MSNNVKITGLNTIANSSITGNIIIPVVDPTTSLAFPDGQTLQSNLNSIGNFILNQGANLTASFSLPVYTSNTARDSAILSPTPGMMIYVTGSGLQVRGATQWNTVTGSGT